MTESLHKRKQSLVRVEESGKCSGGRWQKHLTGALARSIVSTSQEGASSSIADSQRGWP